MKLKRILAAITAAVITLSSASLPAFAETAAASASVKALTWDDSYPGTYGITGAFTELPEAKFKVFIPDNIQPIELTDADRQQGFIAFYGSADQSLLFAVQYLNGNGMTMDSYQAYLEGEADISEVERGIINGLEFITYEMPDKDGAYMDYLAPDGTITEFCFTGVSNETYFSDVAMIVASIQKTA